MLARDVPEGVLEHDPELTEEDLKAVRVFAAERAEERVSVDMSFSAT